MFDKKKYDSTQSKLKDISNNLEKLERLKANLFKKLDNIQDKCSHELILVYEIDYYRSDGKSSRRNAVCLFCNKEMKLLYEINLENDKIDMVYKVIKNGKLEILDKNNILDLTEVVSRNYWGTNLYIDAKELLNNLYTDEISIKEVKKLINNSLVEKYQTNKSLRKLYKED